MTLSSSVPDSGLSSAAAAAISAVVAVVLLFVAVAVAAVINYCHKKSTKGRQNGKYNIQLIIQNVKIRFIVQKESLEICYSMYLFSNEPK